MKVCDLTQFYSPFSGGVKRYIEEKRRFTHTSGHEHLLIIPGEKTLVERSDDTRTYQIRSPLVSQTSRYRVLLNLNSVEEILLRERPDVIESSDPYQVAWKAIASGSTLRIPVVGFYHSHFAEAYLRTVSKYLGDSAAEIMVEIARNYVRWLYNQFSRTFVPSAGLAQVLREWGVENVLLNELGVNTETFRPLDDRNETRQELSIPVERTLLLYVGRLAAEKNVRTLFQAFELLHQQQRSRFHLHVVGDGPQREAVKSLQALTGAVTWSRYCSEQSELARIYRAADLFVHPGVQETFGLVALESQACGTPVVGIRGSYLDRVIFNDQSHWARENTSESLAAAITGMSRVDLAKAGRQAHLLIADRYSWQKVFSRMFAVYEQLRR